VDPTLVPICDKRRVTTRPLLNSLLFAATRQVVSQTQRISLLDGCASLEVTPGSSHQQHMCGG